MSKLIRNWVLGAFVCAVASLIVLVFVERAKSSDFRKAAEWHKVHDNVILFDGHRLSLPQDWWEKYPPEDGKRGVAKASRSLSKVLSAGIILQRKRADERMTSEDEIQETMESIIQSEKKGNHGPIPSMVVVRAASTKIYCMRTLMVAQVVDLRCHVVGAPITISAIGPPSTEKEIEGIISTFE